MIGSGVAAKGLHGVRVCIIPRPENNYRPLALRHRTLGAVSGLLIAVKVITLGVIALMPATAQLSTITNARIIQLINVERETQGLVALTTNEALNAAALGKAQDMLDQDYFAHISPSGVTPWFWMAQEKYTYQMAGENLAIDFVEVEDVVVAWMASPTHRENVLEAKYTETGVAVLTGEYQGSTSTVVVHMFGRPLGATSPSVSEVAPQEPIREEVAVEATPLPTPSVEPVGVPRIGLESGASVVGSTALVTLAGEPGSTVIVLINSEIVETIGLPASGEASIRLSLADIPDGRLVLSAYARNGSGATSVESATVEVTKDTQGPLLARDDVSFVVGPATDRPAVVAWHNGFGFEALEVVVGTTELQADNIGAPGILAGWPLTGDSISLTPIDRFGNAGAALTVSLQPAFSTERDTSFVKPTSRLNGAARAVTIVIALILIFLLMLAVMIRIRVQHPKMIAHASFVLLLAGVILLI